MSDPNVPQGPPAGEAPPLGGWPSGSRPGSELPARPPVARSAAPPTEAPPAWSAPTPEGDPKRPSTGALIAALSAVIAVLLLAGGLAIVLADSNDQARVEAQPRRSAPPTTSTPPPTTQPGGLGEVIGGDDPGAEPTTTQPGTNEPTTTEPSTAPPTTADPNTEATVDEVIAFIEKTRGAKFETRPDVEFKDDAAFEEGLLADFDEQKKDLEDAQVLYHALGLLPADVDLAETMKSALGLGVVGYYDPETKEMVVRGTQLTPYVRTVLAHELTHAFDDQRFDLDRPKLDKATDETGYGFTVLTEGSASYVEDAYRDQMSSNEKKQASAEELQAGSDPAIFDIPLVILSLLTAPYTQGLPLVEAIVDEGGVKSIGDAFAEPPTTSEEVMTPEKYQRREGSVKVPKPKADGKEVEAGVFGQLGFTTLLTDGLSLNDPAPGTEGWAGDSYVTWLDESDHACVRIDSKLDSAGDAQDLKEGLDTWAEKAPVDAEIQASGDELKLTSCATDPSSGGTASGL